MKLFKSRSVFKRFGIFARDRSAVTAVDTALVGFPFFMSLLGIWDISTMYLASTALENGTQKVARNVRIGVAQSAGMSATAFKQALCNEVSSLLACDSRLQVDVRVYNQFNQTDFTQPLNPDGTLNMAFQYNLGTAGDVVVVRTFYVWDIVTPFFSDFLSNMAGGSFLLTAAAAFRNEPFTAGNGSWNGS